ncbi:MULTISPECIES: type 3 dihydrofolate reductase [Pseudoalteromonas]|uniref:Dihydrofolate reductase n=1 Tax=Pseudoalteromonas amylolytica TaxID=1859457 RepID=A0A1S1MTG7_9GAMM|nr:MULTISPECIES: type 3 dihydrofolate reductase [Pseudoalteromonas]MCF6435427.1 type 3 dihydrofolate reductase [Pseudoalteromonas sp. MMG022]OHU88645.1 diacylglycerol kinase [Pseudoalteromonas sp. JW3]OHU90488.1 diacylglycerol kinase [Pseudoalteromonas amylolytica]
MIISMIAAMANNRVIGQDNKMPWHLPSDLKHFKRVTLNKPVVMGRKTFESIGRPLPGRRNIVITRSESYSASGVEVVSSPQAALELVSDAEEIMIIGGGNIYEQFLPMCERLYLTFIDLDVAGDTCFPDYTKAGHWEVIEEQSLSADECNPHNHKFVTLKKKL